MKRGKSPKENAKRAKKKAKKFVNIKNLLIVFGILTFVIGGVYQGYKKLDAVDSQMTYLEFWEAVECRPAGLPARAGGSGDAARGGDICRRRRRLCAGSFER